MFASWQSVLESICNYLKRRVKLSLFETCIISFNHILFIARRHKTKFVTWRWSCKETNYTVNENEHKWWHNCSPCLQLLVFETVCVYFTKFTKLNCDVQCSAHIQTILIKTKSDISWVLFIVLWYCLYYILLSGHRVNKTLSLKRLLTQLVSISLTLPLLKLSNNPTRVS